ncbi:SET domain-containing protein-lysine N-methyltransferase [Okeanomitos corallinicola TIOX110]|uniref:SET domain-containing protein-lysine N-methyltransferase n=1 Tax=Okeanomitos corallinicola TIOX110 TaxID=3133117 RepID=A0ABZ2UVB1_9CYAN
MIQVNIIPNKGRGIIATQDISKGTLLEIAAVSIIPSEIRKSVQPKIEVFKYLFVQPSEYKGSKESNAYLVFGLASLCNHNREPNSFIDWVENEIGIWSHLIAQKDIRKGEEITLFYTNIDEYVDKKGFL